MMSRISVEEDAQTANRCYGDEASLMLQHASLNSKTS